MGYEDFPSSSQTALNQRSADRYYTTTSQTELVLEDERLLAPSPLISRDSSPSRPKSTLLRVGDYTPYSKNMTADRSRSVSPSRKEPSLDAQTRPSTGKNASQEAYEMQGTSRTASPLPGSGSNSDEEKIMNEKADNNEDVIEYPHGVKLAIISASLCLAVFLMALDNTIIATAIPKITDQFKSLDDVGWYASSYLLTTCALQLFFGKLYTFYSIKWTFLISIGIFEIGSAICGAAPNSVTLIVGRAIAGVGSAGLFSGALVIIAYTVPMSKRPAYTGIIGAMVSLIRVFNV